MNRVLLAIALALVCSAAVAADWNKPRSQAKQGYVRPGAKQLTQEQLRRRKFEETYVDPYWDPCDYTTNWGPHACGGS